MCFNMNVSVVTLCIGFIANIIGIIVINDPFFTSVSIVFLFLLIMELAEALGWHAHETPGNSKSKHNKNLMRYSTQLALMANVAQPLVAVMALIPYSSADIHLKAAAVMAAVAYAVWLCYQASHNMSQYVAISKDMEKDYTLPPDPCRANASRSDRMRSWGEQLEYRISKCLEYVFGEKNQDCYQHVIFPWWQEISSAPYTALLVIAIVFLVRPMSYMIYTFSSIAITLGISVAFFKDGAQGSLWCWFTSFLCILNPIAYYLLVKRKGKGVSSNSPDPIFGKSSTRV